MGLAAAQYACMEEKACFIVNRRAGLPMPDWLCMCQKWPSETLPAAWWTMASCHFGCLLRGRPLLTHRSFMWNFCSTQHCAAVCIPAVTAMSSWSDYPRAETTPWRAAPFPIRNRLFDIQATRTATCSISDQGQQRKCMEGCCGFRTNSYEKTCLLLASAKHWRQ